MKILLTSTSSIKLDALKRKFAPDRYTISTMSVNCNNPEQPVGKVAGLVCCKRRIESILILPKCHQIRNSEYDIIVSIENGIEILDDVCSDVVHIVEYNCKTNVYTYARGCPISFDKLYWDFAMSLADTTTLGWSITIGDIYKKYHGYDSKNWVKGAGKMDRGDQIYSVLQTSSSQIPTIRSNLIANVRYILDYPKPSILFKDISPILANAELFQELIEECRICIKSHFTKPITHIVGLESRGFILGSVLAKEFGCGFLMVRKKGKLPPPVVSADYIKEYGTDTFEMQPIFNPEAANVLIVDDLIATGGSIACAVTLLTQLCIPIAGCFAILQVDELKHQADDALKGLEIKVLL